MQKKWGLSSPKIYCQGLRIKAQKRPWMPEYFSKSQPRIHGKLRMGSWLYEDDDTSLWAFQGVSDNNITALSMLNQPIFFISNRMFYWSSNGSIYLQTACLNQPAYLTSITVRWAFIDTTEPTQSIASSNSDRRGKHHTRKALIISCKTTYPVSCSRCFTVQKIS